MIKKYQDLTKILISVSIFFLAPTLTNAQYFWNTDFEVEGYKSQPRKLFSSGTWFTPVRGHRLHFLAVNVWCGYVDDKNKPSRC